MEEKRHARHQRWREISVVVRVLIVLAGIAVACGAIVLMGYVLVWLWNWLMPTIFRLPTIGFWQALGLLVLTTILFNRPRSLGHGSRERWRKRAFRDRLRKAEQGGAGSASDGAPEET